MSIRMADDTDEISKRIRQLQVERGERQHVWSVSEPVCSICKVGKQMFLAYQPCPGPKEDTL